MWRFIEDLIAFRYNSRMCELWHEQYIRASNELVQTRGQLKWYQQAWELDARTIESLKEKLSSLEARRSRDNEMRKLRRKRSA